MTIGVETHQRTSAAQRHDAQPVVNSSTVTLPDSPLSAASVDLSEVDPKPVVPTRLQATESRGVTMEARVALACAARKAGLLPLSEISASKPEALGPGLSIIDKGPILFHWTTAESAASIAALGPHYAELGKGRTGQWKGPGFYLSDDISRWTNDTGGTCLVVFRHDGRMVCAGPEWVGRQGFPQVDSAVRLGIDAYADRDELVLYNTGHVVQLSEDEARAEIEKALRSALEGPAFLGRRAGLAAIAAQYLEPKDAVALIVKAYIDDYDAGCEKGPSRKDVEAVVRHLLATGAPEGFRAAAELCFHPSNPSGPSVLSEALGKLPPTRAPSGRDRQRLLQACAAAPGFAMTWPAQPMLNPQYAAHLSALPRAWAVLQGVGVDLDEKLAAPLAAGTALATFADACRAAAAERQGTAAALESVLALAHATTSHEFGRLVRAIEFVTIGTTNLEFDTLVRALQKAAIQALGGPRDEQYEAVVAATRSGKAAA